MNRLFIILVFFVLLLSGCEQMLFDHSGNSKRGQSYDDFDKEQNEKKEEAQRHERWQD